MSSARICRSGSVVLGGRAATVGKYYGGGRSPRLFLTTLLRYSNLGGVFPLLSTLDNSLRVIRFRESRHSAHKHWQRPARIRSFLRPPGSDLFQRHFSSPLHSSLVMYAQLQLINFEFSEIFRDSIFGLHAWPERGRAGGW
jgi:hypothetical protein